jgi:hypothetical protein
MTSNFSSDSPQPSASWTQIGFFAIAILFNLCLVAQLLTVGLAVFDDPSWWSLHVLLVRGYSGLAALLLIGLPLNPFPRKIQILTGIIVTLLILEFITIHLNFLLPLGVLHPLIGFALFTFSTTLIHRVSQVVFPKSDAVTSV